jgi:adenylate cyclase
VIGRSEREAGHLAGAEEIAVCFADLVGFTRLGGEVEVEELGSVARGLARLAADAAEPPVRLIKTIGDAAMFVSPDPGALVEVALSLVENVESAELPSLRVGVACGPAFQRSGDFYGHSVNLASRVTGVARPGSVLCTQEVRDAAQDAFEWSAAGRFRLKGVQDREPLYRARRRSADDGRGPAPAERETKRPGADRRRRRASR